jgi:hypothetical protein
MTDIILAFIFFYFCSPVFLCPSEQILLAQRPRKAYSTKL